MELERRSQRQKQCGRISLLLFTVTAVLSLAINDSVNGITTEMNHYYNNSNATLFCCTGIACLVMLILLIHIIRKAFTDELNQEMRQLVISEITFVSTFLIRVILIILVNNHYWIDFARDYPGCMGGYFRIVMFPLQFLIYNFLHYLTLMYMHYENFHKRTERQSEVIFPDVYEAAGSERFSVATRTRKFSQADRIEHSNDNNGARSVNSSQVNPSSPTGSSTRVY